MIVTPKCARIIIEDLIYKWTSPSVKVDSKLREGGPHTAEYTSVVVGGFDEMTPEEQYLADFGVQ